MSETLIGLLHKSSSHSRPSQIAWAVVWGCVCGLLPKTSLLFPACLLVSFAMPIHFVTAGLCMLMTSCCSPLLHPLLGNLGHWLLQGDRIRQLIQSIDQVPLAPWLKLHNTVVLGSLSFSVVTSWPLYWLMHQILLRPYANWQRLRHEIQLATPASVQQISSQSKPVLQPSGEPAGNLLDKPPLISPHVEPQPLAASLNRMEAVVSTLQENGLQQSNGTAASSLAEAIDSIHALEDLLEKVSNHRDCQVDANAVLARATKASELVDEILQSLDALVTADSTVSASSSNSHADSTTSSSPESVGISDTSSSESSNTATSSLGSSNPDLNSSNAASKRLSVRIDAPQTFQSHDTKISIYRRARTGDTLRSNADQNTHSEKDSMPTVDETTAGQTNLAVVEPPQSSSVAARTNNPAPSTTTTGTGAGINAGTVREQIEMRHEEALRHLLSHLRALKEKV